MSKLLSQLKSKNIKTEFVIFLVQSKGSLHDVVSTPNEIKSEYVTFNIHLEILDEKLQ